MCNWECKNLDAWDAHRHSRYQEKHEEIMGDIEDYLMTPPGHPEFVEKYVAIATNSRQFMDAFRRVMMQTVTCRTWRVTVVCDGSSTGLPFFQYYHNYFGTTTLFIGILPLTWLKQPTFGNHMKHLQTLPDRVLPSANCFTRIGLQVTPSTWLDRVDWSAPIRRCEQLP